MLGSSLPRFPERSFGWFRDCNRGPVTVLITRYSGCTGFLYTSRYYWKRLADTSSRKVGLLVAGNDAPSRVAYAVFVLRIVLPIVIVSHQQQFIGEREPSIGLR
jgi:hypothetical protein